MNTLLDIISATSIGGFLMLTVITTTDLVNESFFNFHADAIAQQNMTQLTRIIEHDLRKIGFGLDEATKSQTIQLASASQLKFLTHLNLDADTHVKLPGVSTYDSVVDTIAYSIIWADSIQFADTTIHLYDVVRTVTMSTGHATKWSIGRVGNSNVFRYLDQASNITATTTAIQMVEVTFSAYETNVVLSPELVNTQLNNIQDRNFRLRELRRILRASYWRQSRLVSKNLRR